MTHTYSSGARCCGLLLLLASVLTAAPRLNLDQTSFTVLVAAGSNGTTQVSNASNTGASGALNLTVSSNVSWLVPTVEKASTCGLRGGCIPIQLALNTASLAKGVLHRHRYGHGRWRDRCAAAHHGKCRSRRKRPRQAGVLPGAGRFCFHQLRHGCGSSGRGKQQRRMAEDHRGQGGRRYCHAHRRQHDGRCRL